MSGKPKTTGSGKKKKPDEGFASFLTKHGISGDKVLGILTEFGVNSLYDLKSTKEDPNILTQLKERVKDYPIAVKALDKLPVEAIDNAIFYSENPGAEAKAKALADFVANNGVLAGDKGWDKLLSVLRSDGVYSLDGLKAIKEKGTNDPKLKALTANIKSWNQEAGSSFESITAAMVARALRGGAPEASPELKAFIEKKRLPSGTEKELTEFGITTLEQLKEVKEDKTQGGSLDQLKTKLDNSGIRLATKRFDDIKIADVEEEIVEVNSPEAKQASEKSAELGEAIEKVEALRQRVKEAADTEFASVKTDVETEYKSVLKTIKDVCGAEFESANAAALKSKQELSALLEKTITDATSAKKILEGVKKAPRSLARLIREQDMLCGFLISPGGTIRKQAELVKLPENLDRMVRDPGIQREFSRTYKGSETKSFAASSARQSSSTLATAAEASGAGFVGSGVAAVTAAASYADSQKESTESKKFESATTAECGKIHYIYVPKQLVQFNRREIHLSEGAREHLEIIVRLPADKQIEEIMSFYEEYGSHFFLQYSLGGRYQFTAKGESYSETGKGLLISAVAQTTNWAASVSGSYAGMGGAATAAASVKGQKSVAAAQGDRFALNFDSAQVEVVTEVLGGAGLAPRDVWAQSLQFNSTWAVIDRDQPIGVWELVRLDGSLKNDIKNMAPLLEKIWVRKIFLNAVQLSYPVLYNYLKENTTITTCNLLNDAVKQQSIEPEVEIVVAKKTSGSAEHPRVIAGLNEKGLKLIGGGAIVDYGTGVGSLLTGSYPEGNSWVASAKSHCAPCSGTVTAYAIYLYDPYDLWDVKMVSAKTQARSNRPEVTAKLPGGYALTGGGALVDWSGSWGVMLTACCPEENNGAYTGWRAKGKDHRESDTGNATAWVFGIRARNGVEPTPSKVYAMTAQGTRPTLERGAGTEEVIVGGGAAVTYRGEGGMLTCSGLSTDQKKWKAQAKDHYYPDGSLDLTMWVISRNGRLKA
jgi:MAC/Perforin domain